MQAICLLLAGVGVFGACKLQEPLDEMRVEMDRTTGEELTEQYPELVLLQAMPGSLRALAIDYLWIRSETLKQEGRFYDAMQLSKLICMLQPRFPDVWANRAWNLAYNISVTESSARGRWRWITDGIKLLRDEGLRYNPKSLKLYSQLSWIYFHKIGGTTDEQHRAYKAIHAAEFHRILGAPPRACWEEGYDEWFSPIVDAPDSADELLADETVAAFVRRLADSGVELDIGLLDAYHDWGRDPRVWMDNDPRLVRDDKPALADDDPNAETLRSLMADDEHADVRVKALAFVRRKLLTEKYNMKPSWMKELSDRYGPLDWRLVWPHAIYWSSYGLYHCESIDPSEIHSINTARHVLNSLKAIVAQGRMMIFKEPAAPEDPEDPDAGENPGYQGMPYALYDSDLRFVESCHQMHIDMNEFITGKADGKTYRQFKDGHINFLIRALTALWVQGNVDEAEKYRQYVRKHYEPTDPKWERTLEEFVIYELRRERISELKLAVDMVRGCLARACYAGGADNDDEYAKQVRNAYAYYVAYNQKHGEGLVSHRVRMPAWVQMHSIVASRFLFEEEPAKASLLWNRLPFQVQRWCYDPLMKQLRLRPDYQAKARTYVAYFSEPPGMKEFRDAVRRDPNLLPPGDRPE